MRDPCKGMNEYTEKLSAWLLLFSEKITGEIKQKKGKSREKRSSKKKRSRYYSEMFSVVLVGHRLFKSLFSRTCFCKAERLIFSLWCLLAWMLNVDREIDFNYDTRWLMRLISYILTIDGSAFCFNDTRGAKWHHMCWKNKQIIEC